jgi:hypothetical protein
LKLREDVVGSVRFLERIYTIRRDRAVSPTPLLLVVDASFPFDDGPDNRADANFPGCAEFAKDHFIFNIGFVREKP